MAEEVKNTEVKEEKQVKKVADKKKRSRPQNKRRPQAKKAEVFGDSLGALYPDLQTKFQKSRDERIKKQIREAAADPKVQEASKKFAEKNG